MRSGPAENGGEEPHGDRRIETRLRSHARGDTKRKAHGQGDDRNGNATEEVVSERLHLVIHVARLAQPLNHLEGSGILQSAPRIELTTCPKLTILDQCDSLGCDPRFYLAFQQ